MVRVDVAVVGGELFCEAGCVKGCECCSTAAADSWDDEAAFIRFCFLQSLFERFNGIAAQLSAQVESHS